MSFNTIISSLAFDIIFDAYKTVLASDPGYLTDHGSLDVSRLELVLALIGATEKTLFLDQRQQALKRAQWKARETREGGAVVDGSVVEMVEMAAVAAGVGGVGGGGMGGGDGGIGGGGMVVGGVGGQLSQSELEDSARRAYYSHKLFIHADTEEGGAHLR
jgi:hypothetical protein